MGFLPNREICAASKYILRIDAYILYYRSKKPRANRKCPFCPRFRRAKLANRVKDKKIRYGKTDSCVGDSGGPLWKWMGKTNPKANSPTFTFLRIQNSNTKHLFLNSPRILRTSFLPSKKQTNAYLNKTVNISLSFSKVFRFTKVNVRLKFRLLLWELWVEEKVV